MIICDKSPGSAAWFDAERRYRLALVRTWGPGLWLMVVMLNPSTADAFRNDPTIRRVIDFARRWGHGGIIVANLFALRATRPAEMLAHPDPVGALNDWMLATIADRFPISSTVLCAWGAQGGHLGRDAVVADLLTGKGLKLGLTAGGLPRHPLYVPADTQMEPLI